MAPLVSATSHSSRFHPRSPLCGFGETSPRSPLRGVGVTSPRSPAPCPSPLPSAPDLFHQPPDVLHGPAACVTAPCGMVRFDAAMYTGRPCSTLTRIAGGVRCRRNTDPAIGPTLGSDVMGVPEQAPPLAGA